METALRLTEILLACAFLQSSGEHIFGPARERLLFVPRFGLGLMLLGGFATPLALCGLCIHSVFMLRRFNGPYNGGSDRMGLLVLYCVTLAHLLPDGAPSELAFGYLAVQVMLSYFIAGAVKLANPDWRAGKALRDVFAFSAYPVSQDLRRLADKPVLIWGMSWAVMLFEVFFPFGLLSTGMLVATLGVAALFHLANACLFGLNRFLWVWIAAYPSIYWLQGRLLESGAG